MSTASLMLNMPMGRRTLLKMAGKYCPRLLPLEVVMVGDLPLELDLTRWPGRDYACGHFDRQEMAFLVDQCSETGTFVDAGANVGLYTIFVADRRPNARIIAFEPVPSIVEQLKRNIALNHAGNVSVCDYALAEEETIRDLAMNETTNSGENSLLVDQAVRRGFDKKISVRTKTLYQALMENQIWQVDALKADVEGYEFPVLKKFFDEAPKAFWPKAMVLEEYGPTIGLVGGSVVELAILCGYHLVNRNDMNFFFTR